MPVMPKNSIELFGMLSTAVIAQSSRAKAIGVPLAFVISGRPEGGWLFNPEIPKLASCTREEAATAKCVVEMSHDDLMALLAKPSDGMTLYFQGKIKITGEPMAASKLQQLFALLQ